MFIQVTHTSIGYQLITIHSDCREPTVCSTKPPKFLFTFLLKFASAHNLKNQVSIDNHKLKVLVSSIDIRDHVIQVCRYYNHCSTM